MLAQEQSVYLVGRHRLSFHLEPCPTSKHWHHPMAWQVWLHSLEKGLLGLAPASCSFSSFLQDGLNYAEKVSTSLTLKIQEP